MQIEIPELSFSPYSIIVIAAVLAGFGVAFFYMRKFGVGKESIFYTCLLTFVCILFISVTSAFRLVPGGYKVGFSGLGATVGMAIGILLSGLILRDKPECVMASFAVSAPLMYSLSKFGCLFAGCCHGKDYSGPFALVYHGVNEGSYFPAQLIDMAVFLVIHIIAAILVTKMKNKVKAVYILIAIVFPVRFMLEYLRYYNESVLFDWGQFKVLLAGLAGLIVFFIWHKTLKINYR